MAARPTHTDAWCLISRALTGPPNSAVAHTLRELLIHQYDSQFIRAAVEQVSEAIEFAQYLRCAREVLQGDASVATLESLERR
jgi:hypothetical protein